ncbi:hypothetical protein C8R47DRAFT_1075227 [Mycena vitilis]|nr:hypothetical protein C8R47DRAFT_1075227 [Mycena vitilis]
MTEPSVRRNPAREARTRVRRNPDEPVSFALPPPPIVVSDSSSDEELVSSDDELVRDLAIGFHAAARSRTARHRAVMNEPIVLTSQHVSAETIIVDSPPPLVLVRTNSPPPLVLRSDNGQEMPGLASSMRNRGQSPDIDDVDDKEGTVQERAAALIGHILHLRGLDIWPAEESVASNESPSNNTNELTIRSPSPPVALAVSITYTIVEGGPRCLYFVGVLARSGCRSFCQIREFRDPFPQDGALLLRLQYAGGPVGRALATILNRADYFVGTSDFPVPITGDYANHRFNFREVNSLVALESSYDPDDIFFPIPASPERAELLRMQRQPEDTPVYVLYVYHQLTRSLL